MFNERPFYHSSIRNVLIGFGKLFSDITFERKDSDGNVAQLIKVPVAPGNREKWLQRLREDPALSGKTQIVLPRIGFELGGLQYNPARKLATLNQFSGNDTGKLDDLVTAYAPVPYDLELRLYVVCKTQGDALQIVEQILPFFTPDYTLTINMFPEVGINQDVPIILQGVSMEDNYDGSFDEKRTVTYVLSFVAQAYLLGPSKKEGNTILHTRIKVGETDPLKRLHSWDVNEDSSITGAWTDLD